MAHKEVEIPVIPEAVTRMLPAHFGVPKVVDERSYYSEAHQKTHSRITYILRKMYEAPKPRVGRPLVEMLFVEDLTFQLFNPELFFQSIILGENLRNGFSNRSRYDDQELNKAHTTGAAVVIEALSVFTDDAILERLDRIGIRDQFAIRAMLRGCRASFSATLMIAEAKAPSLPQDYQLGLVEAVSTVASIFPDSQKPAVRMGAGICYQAINMVWSRLNGGLPITGPNRLTSNRDYLTVQGVLDAH